MIQEVKTLAFETHWPIRKADLVAVEKGAVGKLDAVCH